MFADVTSANVVGYNSLSIDGTSGSIMIAPSFLNVGTTTSKYKLSDIKVSGYTGNQSGAIALKVLNSAGGCETDETYDDKWFRWYDTSSKKGWYNKAGNTKVTEEDVEFTYGDSLWITRKPGLAITVCGQVYTDDKLVLSIDGSSGSIGLGNPFNTQIDLSDIKVIGYTGNQSGAVALKVLNSAGGCAEDETYANKWFRWYDTSSKKGWYNKTGNTQIPTGAVKFNPGDGLWITRKAGLSLEITNPTPIK